MSLAEKLSQIFKGNPNAYGTYTVVEAPTKEGEKVKGQALTVRSPVTLELWENHVKGLKGLGIIPIAPDNTCAFGAIDIDIYPMDYEAVARRVKYFSLPLIPCKTKSGGIHLYHFVEVPIPAKEIRKRLMAYAAKMGYGSSEIFPKQDKLGGPNDVGNWINMPYYGGDASSRCGFYPDGNPMTLEEFFIEVAEVQTMPLPTIVSEAVHTLPEAPPCLQEILSLKVSSGNRNTVLTNLAIYLKKVDPDTMALKLSDINDTFFDPPIARNEVQLVVNSVSKKTYNYQCKNDPLKKFCNREACLQREHGVRRAVEEGDYALENLAKYDSDPPIWFVDIKNMGVRLELTTDELQNQAKFQTKCINAANTILTKMKPPEWTEMLTKLLKEVTIIQAPKESSAKGQLAEYLEIFCTQRAQAKSLDELALGRAYTDNTHHSFILADLMKFLIRNNFKELSTQQVSSYLNTVGGHSFTHSGRGRVLSYLKIPKFDVAPQSYEIQGINKKEIM